MPRNHLFPGWLKSHTLTAHRRTWVVLLLLIAACAGANLTKAVHVDDSTYLDIVRAILADPLHPMSGTTYSIFTTRPVSFVNQPHLFFYAQALVMLVFRDSELALHGLTALAAGWAILAFHGLAELLVRKRRLLFTALFALSPAFLPGQNLMVDVPLIALWLTFFWALLSATEDRAKGPYSISAVMMALACLVKYTSLVLLPIFAVVVVCRRKWRVLWLLAVPTVALVGWSLFNYFDYGSIHLLGREVGTLSVRNVLLRTVEWTAGLGAVATFTVMFLSRANLKRLAGWPLAGGCVTGVTLFLSSHGDRQIAALWAVFLGNGVLALGLVYQCLVRDLRRCWREDDRVRLERNVILVLWVAGAFSFVVLFAPFMAVRHVLLAIPALLLLIGHSAGRIVERRWRIVGLGLTAGLGALLALSDYELANVYREQAPRLAESLPPDATVWFGGHWGWQWYAGEAGMKPYDATETLLRSQEDGQDDRPAGPRNSRLRAGDYVILPTVVVAWMPPEDRQNLKRVDAIAVKAGPSTWVRTMAREPRGGYYGFSFADRSPPWRFSNSALETFHVFEVVGR